MAASRGRKGSSSPNKRESVTRPVTDFAELTQYWDRAFALEGGYRGLSVEVVGRDNNVLSFYVLSGEGKLLKKGKEPFVVNLDDGMEAWSSLPSTAQQVDPESSQRIGYLFVTSAWLDRNKKSLTLLGEPIKWPRLTSL